MTAAIILSTYCGLIVLASLLGGLVPHLVRLTHRRLEIAISFVAGVILGVGLLHLLPHALAESRSYEAAMGWVLGGFLVMFFLDRFFHFHQHDAPGLESPAGESHDSHDCQDQAGHDHPAAHGHARHRHAEIAPRLSNAAFSWSGAAVGLTMHSLIEGLALAAGVAAELHEGAPFRWAGLGIFLAVVLHKPFDSLTVGTLMAASGWPARHRHLVNLLFALVVPCGVLLYMATAGPAFDEGSRLLGPALAFAAGAFVCIASSDLLPELQFHSHDRGKLSAALLLGIALAAGIVWLERSSHPHAHDSGHETEHHDGHHEDAHHHGH
jgi:zinc and cadmium transporter